LITLKTFNIGTSETEAIPILTKNFTYMSKLEISIETLLKEIDSYINRNNPKDPQIKSLKLCMESFYEVNQSFSVGETLNDLLKVTIISEKIKDGSSKA
jgi:hypothetical protein